MAGLEFALAWIAMLFAGWGTLRGCGRGALLAPEAVGLALLVGSVWLALATALLSPFGLVTPALTLAVLAIVMAGGAAIGRRREVAVMVEDALTQPASKAAAPKPRAASIAEQPNPSKSTSGSTRSPEAVDLPQAAEKEARHQATGEPASPRTEPAHGGAPATETAASTKAWLTLAPALVVVVLCFVQACGRPVFNVDAQRRWVLRAQWTAAEHTLTPAFAEDPAVAASHPSYPPLVPAAAALALQLGGDRDHGMRPGFPVFLFALCAVVHGLAWRRAGPLTATLAPLAVALTPALGLTDALGLGAAAAHADVALAAFLTAASVLVLDALRGARVPLVLLALVALGAAWTKNEGMPFVLAMGALTFLFGCGAPARKLAWRAAGVLVLTGLAGLLVWKALAHAMPVMDGEDYVSGGILAVLAANLERLPTILARVGAELTAWSMWGGVWLAVPLLIGVAVWKRAGRGFWLTLAWLATGLGLVVLAYVATGWKGGNYQTLMDVSLARLLAHHAPLVVVLWVLLLDTQGTQDERSS